MKKKKLVKQALEKPQLYSEEEKLYFHLWLKAKKKKKEQERAARRLQLEKNFLLWVYEM